MESLLKLSGLLGRDDDRTDLGTLERRIADKASSQSNGGTPTRDSARSSKSNSQLPAVQSPHNTPQVEKSSTPVSPPTKQPSQEKEEAVEELSDMMCSLVTNNCGETRYIGRFLSCTCEATAHGYKDPLQASPSFLRKGYSGSTRRQEIPHSKI